MNGSTAEHGRTQGGYGHFGSMFGLPPLALSLGQMKVLAALMTKDPDTADSAIPAGYTILGQFITHELVFDGSPLDLQDENPVVIQGGRTPRFDLDSVYERAPQLPDAPPRLGRAPQGPRMETRHATDATGPDDVPRYGEGQEPPGRPKHQAIIGDVRNDENLLICQLHLAFLRLHNVFVDHLSNQGLREDEQFDEARRLCQWYFQWVVVNDYLPRIVGQRMVDQVLELRRDEQPRFNLAFYPPPNEYGPMMPVEFAVAAFRFGHSMIRPGYRLAVDGVPVSLFGGNGPNLAGSQPIVAARQVDWPRFFFELPSTRPLPVGTELNVNHAKKIDSHLPRFLERLPESARPEGPGFDVASLALRDLIRSVDRKLPSGQSVAQWIKDTLGTGIVLSNADLGLEAIGWQGEAPLWFYILKEAELTDNDQGVRGEQLGPVGGRIVAEVILGLLKYDKSSYLMNDPMFEPQIDGGPIGDRFTVADILRLAGVTPWGR